MLTTRDPGPRCPITHIPHPPSANPGTQTRLGPNPAGTVASIKRGTHTRLGTKPGNQRRSGAKPGNQRPPWG